MGDATASLEITFAEIASKVGRGVRIGRDEALWLWKNASDEEMRSLAGSVRGRFHAAGSCTYMVMRIINYTNVCVAQCDYCAFYTLPGQAGGYVLSHEDVFAKLDELLELLLVQRLLRKRLLRKARYRGQGCKRGEGHKRSADGRQKE